MSFYAVFHLALQTDKDNMSFSVSIRKPMLTSRRSVEKRYYKPWPWSIITKVITPSGPSLMVSHHKFWVRRCFFLLSLNQS